MIHPVFLVAKDEWRYWLRTRLAMVMLIVGFSLSIICLVVNTITISRSAHSLEHQQNKADTQFLEQPDRHPHRMVHYGHYVFRTPTPLSSVDPGINALTGNAIFLEGHRQNTATFAEQQQSAGLNRFSRLSPSFLLQVAIPLFIIIIGYASVTREKETGTVQMLVAQGVHANKIVFGKFLALLSASFLFLVPLLCSIVWTIINGEPLLSAIAFGFGYIMYMTVWASLVTVCSSLCQKSNVSLVLLMSLWMVFCILLPRLSSSAVSAFSPSPSKIESDFDVIQAMKKLGDGHNASDPAFAALKANLLAQYNVNDIKELPINFRGVVAQYSEQQLTEVLNTFAEQRMNEEQNQAHLARQFGWLTPMLALSSYSMSLAATDLDTHHRFLREAENVRFKFVQGLNSLHETTLDYADDINRNQSKESGQKARISADNWRILSEFSFQASPPSDRLARASLAFAQLLLWLIFGLACMSRLIIKKERIL
jgi:ABC-2 type transport system permease protein